MNVIIVAPTFFPVKDVGIFRMTTLADYLLGKNEHVVIARNNRNSVFAEREFPYRYLSKVEELPVNDKNRFFKSSKAYKATILEYCQKNKTDLLIYTCGPYYAMKIAPEIKKMTGIPYILDIRDFWLKNDEESIKTVIKQNLIYPIKWLFQNRAFRYASKIVVVSENVKKRYLKFFNTYKEKICVVYNGYDDQRKNNMDENVSELLQTIDNSSAIKIGFSGVLCQYSINYTKELFKALNYLNKEYKNIRLYHMGKYEQDIFDILEKNDINKEIYQHLGYLPNETCIEILAHMDINAVINLRKQGLGTKAFDYLHVRKPIMYIGNKDTEMSDFLGNVMGAGVCSSSADMIEYIKEADMGNISNADISLEQYTRSFQNEIYYKIIRKVTGEKQNESMVSDEFRV